MAGFIINGAWSPTNVPKQNQVFNDFRRYLLLEGPRRSGKSVAAQHKVFRHMVQNPWAKVAIVSRTTKNGKQGAWADLTGPIYRTWNAAGMTEFTVAPKHEMDTKMAYFKLRNQFGSESECQLHSIDFDDDVEAKFKDTRFSMFYLIEADRFDELVFSTLCQQLRSLEVPYEQQQFLLDTNPPEEGEDHWLFSRFFSPTNEPDIEDWKRKYGHIHFDLDDNPYLTADEKRDLYRDYQNDPAKLQRYFHGRWVRDSSNSAFADVFSYNLHVVGDEDPHKADEEKELLRPHEKTYVIDVGVDIGDVNTAFEFGVPRVADAMTLCYDIIDEYVVLQEKLDLRDITAAVVAKMDKWEAYCTGVLKLPKPPMWRFWSDPSSMRYRSSVGGTEAQLVELYSNGRITMEPVAKGDGSVRARLELLRRMLYEERIFFSSSCARTLDMLRSLKKGTSQTHIIDRGSKWKHSFDALTYMLSGAMPTEIAGVATPNTKPAQSTVVML